jgi:hypothetical protein
MEQDVDYKTTMVSLALDGTNNACLAVAGDLAGRFEARACGHSPFREWILGGVTGHLATESGRCAFLSR